MTTTHQLQIGESSIEYQLSFAPRETLAISVHPDLRVSVIAPLETDLETVEARVRKRASWILRQQRELAVFLPHVTPRQYVSGETHLYLGRQYRLKVIGSKEQEEVKLIRGFLQTFVMDKQDQNQIQHLLEEWYRRQAQCVFQERLEAVLVRFRRHELQPPEFIIKKLKARWGSCTKVGVITLNLKLIQVSKPCIDYVIAHELCHLIEHNHSRHFYILLDQIMPDWRSRRMILNEFKVC